MSHIASGFHFNSSDFLFGDVETDVLHDFDVMVGSSSTFGLPHDPSASALAVNRQLVDESWILPNEAFQPRHEIKDRSPPPEQFNSRCFAETRIGMWLSETTKMSSTIICIIYSFFFRNTNGTS